MPSSVGPLPEDVQGWLEDLERQVAELQAQIDPLLAEQARLQDRRTILKELLASFGDTPSATSTGLIGETTRERVHRQAVEIFTDVGRGLHSNDLHAEFVRRGYEVPGAGKPNNLTVHLTGWADIASPERGIYGLVEHVGEQRPRPAPRRRRKRKA